MQTVSNIARIGLCGGVAIVMACAPLSAAAFSLPDFLNNSGNALNSRPSSAAAVSLSGVCARLGSLNGSVSARLASAAAEYQKKAEEKEARTAAALSAKSTNNASARAAADVKLEAYFKRLETIAGTDAAKKAAVSTFKVRVVKASDVRRDAVDAAARIYAEGVSTRLRERAAEVKTLGEQMRTELSEAIAGSDTRCRSGSDVAAVRTELQKVLASVERSYTAKLTDRTRLMASLAVLADERKAAIAKADATFAGELDASSQDLRTVLP